MATYKKPLVGKLKWVVVQKDMVQQEGDEDIVLWVGGKNRMQ